MSKTEENKKLANQRRPGTAGISGHLYEIKLIGLLLLRALNDDEIEEFHLGSNINNLGAFDDIVFKYYLKKQSRPKIFFLQAKHKDNPQKDKLTVESVLQSKNDFSLDKYYESYLTIQKKINEKGNGDIFNDDFKTMDCSFLFYTPSVEHFDKKKLIEVHGKETLMSTGYHGQAFMFNYDDHDLNTLFKNIASYRAISLAKAFVKSVNQDNYTNMLWNQLIKTYHVFLAQNVVEISIVESDHLIGKFRKSFLESKDEILLLMKDTMFREFKSKIKYDFKLPLNFGNTKSLSEEECIDTCKIIKKIMRFAKKSDCITTIVLDSNILYRYKIKSKEITKIKNLVGEVLTIDHSTTDNLLKFNCKTEKNRRFLEMLEKVIDLGNVRFDINIQTFPQLSMYSNRKHEEKTIKDFLRRLIFYTNQCTEIELENILRNEIKNCIFNENKKGDSLTLNVNCEAIYTKYYYIVLNWWKNPDPCYILTKSCKFYADAQKDILDCPLISVFNFMYIATINSYKLNFDQNAVEHLGLPAFMDTTKANILLINTKSYVLTSMKVIEYLKNITKLNYKCIHWDSTVITNDYRYGILTEVSKAIMDVIVVVLSDSKYLPDLFLTNGIGNLFKNKIIIISYSGSLPSEYKTSQENILATNDLHNSFCDLDASTKHRIIDTFKIYFQGKEISFNFIIEKHMTCLVNEEVLHQIMNNEPIQIGKEPTTKESYRDIEKFYVNRQVYRCIKILNKNIMKVNKLNKDILLITDDIKQFKTTCSANSNANVHRFSRESENLEWKESYGSIEKLIPFVERSETACLIEPQSLKDLKDRIVIISAEPGMGKTTFITHLIMQSKYLDESMCVIKINLPDLNNEFSNWQECNATLRLKWFLSIMYKSFSIYPENYEQTDFILEFTFIDPRDNRFHLSSEVEIKKQQLALFEFQVFLNMYNNDKISLIFDGFDEICPDYKMQAIELFKVLINSRVERLWITSRNYNTVLNKLERELNTFSFQLKRFSIKDQKCFWQKFLNSALPQLRTREIHLLANELFNDISTKFCDLTMDFTSTPLHLRMIVEIYQEYFRLNNFAGLNISESFQIPNQKIPNLTTLYEKFIDIKFHKIRFEEKNKGWLASPDIIYVTNKIRNRFIRNHKKLAAFSLLRNDKAIFTEKDLRVINNLLKQISLGKEKTGIIERIIQNKPKFVHITYAEYFACEFIFDKLRQNLHSATVWQYFIDYVLVMENRSIRRFISSKLEIDKDILNFTSKHIYNALLMQTHASRSALSYSFSDPSNCNNISFFLMKNLKTYLDASGLNDFIALVTKNPFQIPYSNYMDSIIEIVIQLDLSKVQNIFFSVKSENFCMLEHSIIFPNTIRKRALKIMFENMNSHDLTKLLSMPGCTSMILQTNLNFWFFVSKFLDNLSPEQCMLVFSARDKYMKVPAHYAAEYHKNYEFFEVMANLLRYDQLREVCTLTDIQGFIPLRYFWHDDDSTSLSTLKIDDVICEKDLNVKRLDADTDIDDRTLNSLSCDHFVTRVRKTRNNRKHKKVYSLYSDKFGLLCYRAGINFSSRDGFVILTDMDNPYNMW